MTTRPPPSLRRRDRAHAIPVLHAVTDDLILAHPDFLTRARVVMRAMGRRGALHLRARQVAAARLYEIAAALAPEQESTGCWVAINDRVDVALAASARAAQLTSRSMSVADARAVAPSTALGASVHSLDDARMAERDGADWLVAGHVFDTGSHVGAPGRGVPFIEELVRKVPVPCIAIGGIRPSHVAMLRGAGVHGIAAISGLWRGDADDAERAAIEYLLAYDQYCGS